MRTWVMDLDGTICTLVVGKAYETALPFYSIIEWMKARKDEGDRIIIHTARGMNTYDGDAAAAENAMRPLTEEWLSKHHVPYDKLIFGKPSGDAYIDDKALRPLEIFSR